MISISFDQEMVLIGLIGSLLLERWVSYANGSHVQVFVDDKGMVVSSLLLQRNEIQTIQLDTFLLVDIAHETAEYSEDATIDKKMAIEADEANAYNISQYLTDWTASHNYTNNTPFKVIMPELIDYRRIN